MEAPRIEVGRCWRGVGCQVGNGKQLLQQSWGWACGRTLPWEPGLGVWREPPVCIRRAATQVGGDSGRSPRRAVLSLPASSLSLVATLALPTHPLPLPGATRLHLGGQLPQAELWCPGPCWGLKAEGMLPITCLSASLAAPRARPGVPGGLDPQRWAAQNEPWGIPLWRRPRPTPPTWQSPWRPGLPPPPHQRPLAWPRQHLSTSLQARGAQKPGRAAWPGSLQPGGLREDPI